MHLLRYLKKNTEEATSHWSVEMAELLCEMNKSRNERFSERNVFAEEEIAAYESRYD